MKTTDIVRSLVEETVFSLGYELIDIEFKKEQADWVLTLFIDKPEGVMLSDCEGVRRTVEPLLDEADPIVQAYFLSVSSPGLDRPLKSDSDLKRNIGKRIVVKLYVQVERKKEFLGTLTHYGPDAITLTCEDGMERVFLRKDIAQMKPYIEF